MKHYPFFIGLVLLLGSVLVILMIFVPQQAHAGQLDSILKPLGVLQNTYQSLVFRNFSQVEPGKIVFVSDASGNADIYSMNYDGSGMTQLTTDPANDGGPDWSPDGTKIVFFSNRTGEYRIHMMNADGSNQVLLNDMNKCYSAMWSPSGTKIVFYCRPAGDSIIYTMNPDGTGVFQVTQPSISGELPYWSPDGNRIAFNSVRTTPGIYVIDADGNNQSLLLEVNFLHSFSWSPDGTKLALSKQDPPNYNFDLYIYDIDSGATTRITETTRSHFSVDWSPQGRFLMFDSNFEGLYNFNIYKIALNGGEIWRLTTSPTGEHGADWGR